ncbi:MAG: glycosyltransferase, partial [Gemmatimonadota bacterium]|nr:glycosyltransferase [Gemmatimonadota bacterium]
MNFLAWILLATPVVVFSYAYLVYPLLLWFLARLRKDATADRITTFPTVSVVIPAYNEEQQIGGAIEAVLAQDYPAEKLHILILSDASNDATDRIVGEYSRRGVE